MNLEQLELQYIANARQPIWGGHLKRGEPITGSNMQRWLDNGWIEAVGTEGYRMTDKGRQALQANAGSVR